MWGLPPDSRVKRHFSSAPASTEVTLLATIADRLSFIAWSKTKDAEKGRNRPPSILDILYGKDDNRDLTTFNTKEDYEITRKKLLEGIDNGNTIR